MGGWPLGYEERRCCANCPCNWFPRFRTYVILIHQRHRRTDRRTDDMQSQYRAMHCIKYSTSSKWRNRTCQSLKHKLKRCHLSMRLKERKFSARRTAVVKLLPTCGPATDNADISWRNINFQRMEKATKFSRHLIRGDWLRVRLVTTNVSWSVRMMLTQPDIYWLGE